ncbi:glycoside hydrolase family 2 TIM barrel-domain containing protein [Chitinophaga cymbidii]|uniref:glycoside hydrolase family 2 TIM barrel-domain containing protein n=1 Tax=Chitinophaga cymbidii TaxID=1096750 RepID=UPI00164A9EFD|nr:glycoside hydrolase family 2 TIM barrel-domain containing protein [Chitinophaga cymbidii]
MAVLAGCTRSTTSTPERKVFIARNGEKYILYRDGKPFTVKGAAGFTDLRKLHEAGGNTIRTWDTLHLGSILDSAYANNIAVIAGFPMPVSNFLPYYKDRSKVSMQYAAFRDIVNRYKSHPALLMWCLGNEVDFPSRPRYNAFYSAYRRLVKMIHAEDPDHPVTTALINVNRRCIYNIRFKVPDLDLISFNIFGALKEIEKDLKDFAWFWDGPFLITEWGINGPWESEFTAWGAPIENTSTKKAEQYRELYEQFMPVQHPRYLGSCIFYWGRKQEVTHTWFSLFTEEGAQSETVDVMQYLWTGKWPGSKAPMLKYMLLAGRGARDNIMFRPNTLQSAEVLFQGTPGDSLRIHWEILEEDWYTKNKYETNTQKPAVFDSLLLSFGAHTAAFRSPAKEGPYRIFATVYDNNGHFASTNTPFYVVGQ